MIRADLVLGLCLTASAAQGQVFNEPKYFGWLDPPETASATERLGRMMHIDVVGLALVQRRWAAKCSSR